MIIVSGCLLGINCRYNGGNNYLPALHDLMKKGRVIPVCPEQLGGTPTPRPASEIVGGDGRDVLLGKAKVLDINGRDVTEIFLKGAHEVLKIAKGSGAKEIIFKERSPSCGVKEIYDGTFSSKTIQGMGVTTALLEKEGCIIWTEENLPREFKP
ncbi:MAG: DUF523 domain-containing protein [Bacillota bacterium]